MAKGGSGKAHHPKPFAGSARNESKSSNGPGVLDSDDEGGNDKDSSSEDVTEDEEGDELTPAMDAAILQTLRKIREGRGVYEQEDVLAEALKDAQEKVQSLGGMERLKREAKSKPVTVADHRRAELLAELDGADDTKVEPTYVESQRQIRQDAIAAFKSLDDEEDEEDFDFTERPKTDAEEEREAQEYRKFLLEMGGGEDEVRKLLGLAGDRVEIDDVEMEEVFEPSSGVVEEEEPKDDRKSRPKKSGKKAKANDDFLMDYILNRGWIDRSDRHVPTYDEIVGHEDLIRQDVDIFDTNGDAGNAEAGPSQPWGVIEEDEFDDKAEEFENAYNFRYEEPGADTIHAHPRVIDSLVRRPDDTRKAKRAARAEKNAAEREAMEEKTRRKKGEKRREMEKQLGELKKELGNKVDWKEVGDVLEGDFDEAVWERVVGDMLARMGDSEDEKPSWDDDEDDEYAGEAEGQHGDEGQDDGYDFYDGPVSMDADFMDVEPKKKTKKDKKKGKSRPIEEEDLSVTQRADKVKEAMEEYRALDHEDMIGDLPTRFKYTRSAPESFGLTPVEILLASDAELNAIAGMKHLAPYRQRKGFGKTGRGLEQRVRQLKADLKDRRWGEDVPTGKANRFLFDGAATGANGISVGDDGEKKKGKRMGKKERMKARIASGAVDEGPKGDEDGPMDAAPAEMVQDGRDNGWAGRKRKGEDGAGDSQVNGDGEGKKKRRKKKKKSEKASGEAMLEIYD